MKKSDQILLILIVLPVTFILGNLTSDYINIKSVLDKIYGKPEVKHIVNQNQPISARSTSQSSNINKNYNSNMEVEDMINFLKDTPSTSKKIGESYTLGGMEYKVISAADKGTEYEFSKTTGKFIVVKISVKNVGKTSSGLSKILVKDKNDRQYNQSNIMDGVFLINEKNYGSDYNGLAPGFSETYTAVFQVAKDSTGLKLCHPNSTGRDIVCVQLSL